MLIWKSKHKIENISASNDAKQLEFGKHVAHSLRNAPHDAYFDVAMATVLFPVS